MFLEVEINTIEDSNEYHRQVVKIANELQNQLVSVSNEYSSKVDENFTNISAKKRRLDEEIDTTTQNACTKNDNQHLVPSKLTQNHINKLK